MTNFIEFVIVRHGETADNAAGILQGQLDSPLNSLGEKQAQCAAEALAEEHFDAAYSSDLRRALQTAGIVAARHPALNISARPALREWNLGDFEGMRQQELLKEHIDILRGLRVEEEGESAVPHGENKTAFFQRIMSAMQSIADAHRSGDRILLVTHGGAMQIIFRLALGGVKTGAIIPLPDNASISRVRFMPGKRCWQLYTWNERAHLNAAGVHNTLIF